MVGAVLASKSSARVVRSPAGRSPERVCVTAPLAATAPENGSSLPWTDGRGPGLPAAEEAFNRDELEASESAAGRPGPRYAVECRRPHRAAAKDIRGERCGLSGDTPRKVSLPTRRSSSA